MMSGRAPASFQFAGASSRRTRSSTLALALLGGGLCLGFLDRLGKRVEGDSVDYKKVRNEISGILENPDYDDGSYGPVIVRLAWHASGTYDKVTGSGGSDGATMRFCPEKHHGANAGLQVARDLLEPIKAKYPAISYADLWTLAGVVAIEEAAGPVVPWRPGRSDRPDGSYCPPDGRLPDATKGPDHIRAIFYRMGFNDQEIVALVGAHAMGRCHTDRSGFSGPWTKSPTMFSNDYFRELFDQKWTPKKWNGPLQYEDASGDLMMLPADLAIIQDPEFRKWAEIYAKDEERFFNDFSKAFSKLLELGTRNLRAPIPRD
jgi:cytochrome c peroxidase